MNRWLVSVTLCALPLALALIPSPGDGQLQARANPKPRTILLGFDGVDANLAERWMAEGHLPNLKRLGDGGTFRPLDTANPAQSPVSWAVMETSSNPGKTNVPDFVRRTFAPPGSMSAGNPKPDLAGVRKQMVPTAEVGKYVPLSRSESFLLRLAEGNNGMIAVGGLALAVLLLVALVARGVLRFPKWLGFAIGILFAAATVFFGKRLLAEIPPRMPVPIPEMQGERFWDALGKADVRFVGMQVPAAFPCITHENARVLAGLFAPDIAGGPGAWYVYTNDEWAPSSQQTETGGKVLKLYADKDGVIRPKLYGPVDFITEDRYALEIEGLEKSLREPGLADGPRAEYEQRLAEARSRLGAFNEYDRNITVEFEVRPDYAAKKARITIGEQTQEIAEGAWSEDYFEVRFKLNNLLHVDGIVRFQVAECSVDADKNERLRLFVPPISISPREQPPVLPLSSPKSYAGELADANGLYDTIGWACWTNPLKDDEITEQAFLDSLDFTLKWREKQLLHELAKDDWEVLFHVESVTDRAGHMLYRFFDPEHPQYDTEASDKTKLRDKVVRAYGRSFPLRDGILETYKEMDRIVGDVMRRIDAGQYGTGTTLMVVSDHGFQPFRWGVNLNVWLNKMGYLVRNGEELLPAEGAGAGDNAGKEGQTGETKTVGDITKGDTGGFLSYIDWTRTKAYSLGLGKIYINLKGREPKGIVEPADFDKVRAEIIAKLEAFEDPREGHGRRQVVKTAYDGQKIYSGPWMEEPGDVILGFERGYRVSWQTTLGQFEKETYKDFGILDNEAPWTGDHCGVDPTLVRGIFFSNRKLAGDAAPGLLNIAPTILETYGVALPSEWDGTPLKWQ